MWSKSSSRTPDLLAAIAKDLSHSGFYCTPDLEQNAELRILLRGSPTPNYFFAPRIASFASLKTLNLIPVLAGILIFCCFFGLNQVRAFLLCFTSFPYRGCCRKTRWSIRGDDTKVRKLSGSRSYGDARALSIGAETRFPRCPKAIV
jgi:hypothetical protein